MSTRVLPAALSEIVMASQALTACFPARLAVFLKKAPFFTLPLQFSHPVHTSPLHHWRLLLLEIAGFYRCKKQQAGTAKQKPNYEDQTMDSSGAPSQPARDDPPRPG